MLAEKKVFPGIPGNFCTICPHRDQCQAPHGNTSEKAQCVSKIARWRTFQNTTATGPADEKELSFVVGTFTCCPLHTKMGF